MTLRVILMGVAGCGKTSVGQALAARLGVAYCDGDDLHTAANIEKMRLGVPLTDTDRWPWLDKVAQALACDAPVIVGCSALKRSYRDRIRQGAGCRVQFVHLAGSRAVITARMSARTGHYMPTTLIDSQFAALEIPGNDEGAITVDIARPLTDLVNDIAGLLEEASP